ncbi:MAG: hypothetical protein L0Y76_00125 [Ignavibacteria bacterium]|nr:hypothetical protein [Ignavibacteria bacterium]
MLSKFSTDELAKFVDFMKSPFFNRSNQLTEISKILLRKRSVSVNIDPTELSSRIKKELKISDASVRKLLAFLGKSVIRYLEVAAALSDKEYTGILLNDSLLRKGIESSLRKNQNRISRSIESGNKTNADRYFKTSMHYSNLFDASVSGMVYQSQKGSAFRAELLGKTAESVALFALIKLTVAFVNYTLNAADSGQAGKKSFGFDIPALLKALQPAAGFKTAGESVLYELYYKACICFSNLASAKHYTAYKDFFTRNSKKLDSDTLNLNYNFLVNYCLISARLGKDRAYFYREHLSLMKFYMLNDYYISGSVRHLLPVMYRNFTVMCAELDDMELLKYLIDNITEKLSRKFKTEMSFFAKSHYYYRLGDFREALRNLNSVEINKFVYKYDLRNLELKIYYAGQDYEKAGSVLHNYLSAVKNDAMLTPDDRERTMKFLEYFSAFLKIVQEPEDGGKRFKLEFLRTKARRESSFVMRKWILEKMDNYLSKSTGKPETGIKAIK